MQHVTEATEATTTTGHRTVNWFKTGKGVLQGSILPPYLLNLYAEYIMQHALWMNTKQESRLPGEISTTSQL